MLGRNLCKEQAMRESFIRTIPFMCLTVAGITTFSLAASSAPLREDSAAIKNAVAAPTRTPANVLRDKYRHPAQTLGFFGVRPDHTVVEIWPSGGWYTEILAPLTREKGIYYAAGPERSVAAPKQMMRTTPRLYGHIRITAFPAQAGDTRVPDGSADIVLTFRNVHNWLMGDKPFAQEAFRQMYAMLKPGGILGVVDHRLPEKADSQRERTSGYVKVSTVRHLAEAAGFRFLKASEINANPKDSADWSGGVWTLPPSNRGPAAEREKYLAIGESDRMTLKFVKPGV
jgi:predicted methyltransferase